MNIFSVLLVHFLTDGKNNDASIAKNILLNNEDNVLDWLEEEDIFSSIVGSGVLFFR
jgi:hypothetical protein